MPVPNIEEFARQMQGITLVTTHNQQRANRMAKPTPDPEDASPFHNLHVEEPSVEVSLSENMEEPKTTEPKQTNVQAVPVQVSQETQAKRDAVPQAQRRFSAKELRRAVILSEIIGPPKSRRR